MDLLYDKFELLQLQSIYWSLILTEFFTHIHLLNFTIYYKLLYKTEYSQLANFSQITKQILIQQNSMKAIYYIYS